MRFLYQESFPELKNISFDFNWDKNHRQHVEFLKRAHGGQAAVQ